MMVMQLNKDGYKDRNTLNRGCLLLITTLTRSETMKGNNMSKKYTIEEIVDAIDLSCGDSGKTSKEVISILETDVKKNTEDYLKEKTKKAIAELIKSADAFNKKEQLEEERKEKNNGTI